jgi:hypothetical protein
MMPCLADCFSPLAYRLKAPEFDALPTGLDWPPQRLLGKSMHSESPQLFVLFICIGDRRVRSSLMKKFALEKLLGYEATHGDEARRPW